MSDLLVAVEISIFSSLAQNRICRVPTIFVTWPSVSRRSEAFFNGVVELDEPPFRCGAADWKIIWENKMNITNGIFTPPPGMNRLSIFHELEYWHVLKINHLLAYFQKRIQIITDTSIQRFGQCEFNRGPAIFEHKRNFMEANCCFGKWKDGVRNSTLCFDMCWTKRIFFHIWEIYGLHLDLGRSYAMPSVQKNDSLVYMLIFNAYVWSLQTIVIHCTNDFWFLSVHWWWPPQNKQCFRPWTTNPLI